MCGTLNTVLTESKTEDGRFGEQRLIKGDLILSIDLSEQMARVVQGNR